MHVELAERFSATSVDFELDPWNIIHCHIFLCPWKENCRYFHCTSGEIAVQTENGHGHRKGYLYSSLTQDTDGK